MDKPKVRNFLVGVATSEIYIEVDQKLVRGRARVQPPRF